MWRTNSDIIFFGETASMSRVFTALDHNQHPAAQYTGFYNDPDMMVVGMPNFTAEQNRTHLGLWAVSGAPLLAGNDLTRMSASTAGILKNAEVIAIDQDARGLPGVKVAEDSPGRQVYAKVLSGAGRRAVALLNRTSAAATMTVRWADLGLTGAPAAVRDVWAASNAGNPGTGYSTTVPAGGLVLLTITGTDAPATTYEAEAAGNTRTGSAAPTACPTCSGGSKVGWVGNGAGNTLRVNGVTARSSGLAVATVAYINGDATTRTATLTVPGSAATTVAFPPTGSWTSTGTVSVLVALTAGSANTLTFANPSAWAPDIDAIEVRPLH
jgi:hypothetical protein